jgi:hypothetical protein
MIQNFFINFTEYLHQFFNLKLFNKSSFVEIGSLLVFVILGSLGLVLFITELLFVIWILCLLVSVLFNESLSIVAAANNNTETYV